jgi:outer membrane protein assembly factor BamE (lipoprotein component of BamABCDE complex)
MPIITAKRGASLLCLSLLALSVAGMLPACSPTIAKRGYLPDPERSTEIQPGKDTKETVEERWGTPSVVATFDDNVWYYISSTQKETAFFKPETIEQNILVVQFDKEGKVASLNRYDLSDAQSVNFVGRETRTRGRELSFLEQIFGNIGRVGTPTSEDNKPGR